jgi:hypothetical protein
MADFAIAAVEVLRVGLLQSLHELGEGSGTGLNKQMHMVRHQAVGVDTDMELGAVFL